MITFLAVILAPLMGISVTTMIFGFLLASNNIGDSVSSHSYYAKTPHFNKRIDKGSRYECEQMVFQSRMEANGDSDSIFSSGFENRS